METERINHVQVLILTQFEKIIFTRHVSGTLLHYRIVYANLIKIEPTMHYNPLHPDSPATLKQRLSLRCLEFFHWQLRVTPFPGPHGVLILYPHTSNWDFPLGMLAKWAVDVQFNWLGKESLFTGWLGRLIGPTLRSWGGEPVTRDASTGMIERLVQRFHSSPWYWLALSPEGTRQYRTAWRSGFYHIALAAKVPVALAYIDYSTREIGVTEFVELTGDRAADMEKIRAIYAKRRGLHPDRAAPIDF